MSERAHFFSYLVHRKAAALDRSSFQIYSGPVTKLN